MNIVTHAGGAHFDETMACAVLIASREIESITRTNQITEEQLNDPDCLILDIGREHNPDRRNFDHHQLARDAAPSCTLKMVLEWLELYDRASQIYPWLEPAVLLDVYGVARTAKIKQWPEEAIESSISPFETAVLALFSQHEHVTPKDRVWDLLAVIGHYFLDNLAAIENRLAELGERAEFVPTDSFYALVLPHDINDDPTMAISMFIAERGLDCPVCVVADTRSPGTVLKRLGDDPRIDFSAIKNDENITFVHSGGFMAVNSKPLSKDEAVRLIERSLTKPGS